jgi:uncharacterized protein (TIGR02145 family)
LCWEIEGDILKDKFELIHEYSECNYESFKNNNILGKKIGHATIEDSKLVLDLTIGDDLLTPGKTIFTRNTVYAQNEESKEDVNEPSHLAIEVKIGNQIWMTQNLNLDKFRNGDSIPQAKTNLEWIKAGKENKPAWCYYQNDLANGEKYGKLYNWYAVNDPRGLAPFGWHIPSDAEWTQLTDYLGGSYPSGNKMKSINGWMASRGSKGTNSSGFSGYPGGFRHYDGTFRDIDQAGYWWSSSSSSTFNAWGRPLYFHGGSVVTEYYDKKDGCSVRCIKD